MTIVRTKLMAAILGVFLVLCIGARANAATRTVTSLADDGSAGTLRFEVGAAAPGDSVVFGVTGTITLTSGEIAIAKSLTITGPAGAPGIAVSASFNGTIFNISSGIVSISDITMRDGTGHQGSYGSTNGGAIFMSGGTVTLTSCVLTNSRTYTGADCSQGPCQVVPGDGGAIYQHGGSLSLVSCTVSGNIAYGGGGIANYAGSLSISKSAISGNNAIRFGGGIYNNGTATITDSTVNGNQLFNDNDPVLFGAGIMQAGPTMTITNCTISGNTSQSPPATGGIFGGGGIHFINGTLTVANSTITNNRTLAGSGGGIMSIAATLRLTNTIIAGNIADSDPASSDLKGYLDSGDYNLLQTISLQAPAPGTHNIIGLPAVLGPLANNGGPTLTHALLAGSPAYDAGDPNFDPTTMPYDQRGSGFPRVRNGRLDLGAYESDTPQVGSSFIVNTLADHDDGACGVDDCTLREAVNYASAGATVTFTVAGPITLSNGDIVIDKDLSIAGPTTVPGITLSGNHTSRVFTVLPNGQTRVAFSSLTLTAGNGTSADPVNGTSGGAIANLAGIATQVTVDNCTFNGNNASANGGAIRNAGALRVTNSTFSGNTAASSGGAIGVTGTLTVANCTFSGNSAGTSGGAIIKGATPGLALNISNSIFDGNTSPSGPNIFGVVTSSSYNLVQDPSGATIPGTLTITGQSALLGALDDHGGPTQTIALLPGSPALDAGDPAFDTTITPYDQRGSGYPRKVGSRIDIGAFEQQPANVTLSLSGTSMAEAGGVATITATLSNVAPQAVTVNLAFSGTATITSDYTTSASSIVIAAGSTSGFITLTAVPDAIYETVETIVVDATTVVNGSLPAPQQVTATIIDDDAPPALAINNVPQAEGTGGPTNFIFTVTLGGATAQAVTVNYTTANGTATAPADYTASSGTLTFAPGTLTQTITVPVVTDALNEANESFTVALSGATLATITTATGTGTIQDDDAAPTLAINNVTQAEGDSGTTNFVFTVTLTGTSAQTVTVNYATANGTATASSDYSPASGTLTFAPGTFTQTITVPVAGDAFNEADETFTVGLSGATVATVTTATGTGTITNDDLVPALSINSPSQLEGNSGTAAMNFAVTLSAAGGQTVTVSFATSNGSASAGSDYILTSGTLTFPPGTTVQTIAVPINGDTLNEADEPFVVTLSSPSNATINAANGSGTITNDDAVPALAISSPSQVESNSGTSAMNFVVTLSAASGQTVTVNYNTTDGAATAGSDYTTTSGTITFAPGVITQTIPVTIAGDTVNEPNETFTVMLSTPVNATITTATGTGIILNDDGAPTLSISSPSQAEGDSGATNVSFVVTLSPANGQTVTVAYATANGTATAGGDYTTTSGTLTFTAGTTTQTINVPILGDALNEPDETFTVNLASPTNATVATANGTGTIVDDDALPVLSISSVSLVEGNSGISLMNFTVTLSAASGQPVTVNYASANGTATAGGDYTATNGTLTFAPGLTAQTISVPVVGDTVNESNETFTVTLAAPANATLGVAQGTGTIVNDDGAQLLSFDSASQSEGNSGATNMTFIVTLEPASGLTVSVTYATSNGTATAGSDYTATSGTLTFAPGVTTQTVSVSVLGDSTVEPDEAFLVTLAAAVNATIATASGTGTIINDDAVAVAAPSITNISPNSGTGGIGQVVIITGTGLGGATSVTFGGVAAAITAMAPTSVTVTIPAHAPGSVDVAVTTPGGTATSVGGFTFAAALVAIPTLSDWMLLALMAMLGMIAMSKLRA